MTCGDMRSRSAGSLRYVKLTEFVFRYVAMTHDPAGQAYTQGDFCRHVNLTEVTLRMSRLRFCLVVFDLSLLVGTHQAKLSKS